MLVSYKFQSKIYGLLDIIYFRNNPNNPRNILLSKIKNMDSKLLEIAVGTAKNSILIAKQNPKIDIIGIDLSEEMLEIARSKIRKEHIENIELIKMNGTDMAFRNETFDFIIVSLLLHEIPENVSNIILHECIKVLKNNGKLYVIEWGEPKKIFQKIIFSTIKPFEPKEFKVFMKKDLNKYFKENGFEINSIEYGDYSKVIELVKNNNE
jgi:ubiquinone/menaquinone biosynthesis C-methylase UbiE